MLFISSAIPRETYTDLVSFQNFTKKIIFQIVEKKKNFQD